MVNPFQFQAYQSSAPQTIADLMARRGEIAARGAEASGQARAAAIANIGQGAAGELAKYQQEQKDAPIRALQTQQLQNSVTEGQQKIAAGQRALMGQQVLAAAVKQFGDDHQKIAQYVTKNGFPDVADAYVESATKAASSWAALQKGRVATQADADAFEAEQLGRILQAPPANRPAMWIATLGRMKGRGYDTSGQSPTWDDTAAQQQYDLIKPKPDLMAIPAGEPVIDKNNLAAGAVFTAPARAPNSQESDFLLNGKAVKGDYLPGANGQPGKYLYQGQDVTGQAQKIPPASTIINPQAVSDVKEAVAGMKDGTIPPQLPGRATKEYLATLAEARRQGYNLQAAVTDWNATQKHVATLNNAQQTRLNQSINALPELLDSVDALASKWKGGRFPILNRANLALAKGGAYGPEVASVANQLDAQIADITADLGNVYMGGNSPTDHALGLAAKSLQGDWNEQVFHDMVKLARGNVQIRRNSITTTGVQGASPNNPYAPPPASTALDPYAEYLKRQGAAGAR